jgi:transcriptional regulator with XRE-family HTH domain
MKAMASSKKEVSQPEWGERIRRARKAAGLTQYDVAAELDIDQSQVSKLESGARGLEAGSLLQLLQLLRSRGVNVDYVVAGVEPVLLVSDSGLIGELRQLLDRHQPGPSSGGLSNKGPRAAKDRDKP